MQINLELRNDDVSGSIYPRLKFSTKSLHQQSDVKTEIIRAGNSSYVLLIKNLADTTQKIESKDSNQNLDNGTKNI